jgi:hypothetical protein
MKQYRPRAVCKSQPLRHRKRNSFRDAPQDQNAGAQLYPFLGYPASKIYYNRYAKLIGNAVRLLIEIQRRAGIDAD